MKNIIMVGAGGTASHLLHPLVAYLGIEEEDWLIHLWDADIVEAKNLARQLFFPYDINTSKAQALARRFNDRVLTYETYIGEDNVTDAIKDGDIVFICADNMAVRRVINDYCKTLDNIVLINGGNELYSGSAQIYIREDSKNITPPLDFWSPEFDPANDEDDRSALSCAEIAILPGGEQTVMANNSVAALLLQAFARYEIDRYDNTNKDPQWTKVTFDIEAGTFQTSDVRLIGDFDA